jgi:hypothetical protein
LTAGLTDGFRSPGFRPRAAEHAGHRHHKGHGNGQRHDGRATRQARRRTGPFLLVAPFVFDIETELPTTLDANEAVGAVWIPQSMLLDPTQHSFRRVPGMPAEVWFPAIALPGAPLWGFTYRLLVDWWEISSRECAGPSFELARMTLDFLRSRGLIVLSPWHSTAPRNGDELGPAQAAKVSGPIPIDAVVEYFSGLGAIGAKINRIEVRPEYIRIHGLAFEDSPNRYPRGAPQDANRLPHVCGLDVRPDRKHRTHAVAAQDILWLPCARAHAQLTR